MSCVKEGWREWKRESEFQCSSRPFGGNNSIEGEKRKSQEQWNKGDKKEDIRTVKERKGDVKLDSKTRFIPVQNF